MDESDAQRWLEYYDPERYLFATVGPKFRQHRSLSAFDFFSIVIWKSNRAKSNIARRLRQGREGKSWDTIIGELTAASFRAEDGRAKLAVLIDEYGFHLPMASAILTVLWPDAFSVYDVRVCQLLGRFAELAAKSQAESIWPEYEQYMEAVKREVPGDLSLRDKDRVLWARSKWEQLLRDMNDWTAH